MTQYVPDEQLNIIDLEGVVANEADLAARVLRELNGPGHVILRNVPVNVDDLEQSSGFFLRLSGMIGTPVSHDENNSIIWNIKKVPQSASVVMTYSEHSDDAMLHTDSQYREYPEDFFGLLTLRQATCGGGASLLMSLHDVIRSVLAESGREWILDVLAATDFPFVVPTVFNRGPGEGKEFVFAPILNDREIRFREDTLEKALPYHNLSDTALQAFAEFKKILRTSPLIKAFHLRARDLIFINNKTVLHGRTAFSDEGRHLLRIRMNRFSADTGA